MYNPSSGQKILEHYLLDINTCLGILDSNEDEKIDNQNILLPSLILCWRYWKDRENQMKQK